MKEIGVKLRKMGEEMSEKLQNVCGTAPVSSAIVGRTTFKMETKVWLTMLKVQGQALLS